ncbi:MAG: glycosyltransferase family 39 protein, partial [Oscillochloris sp.]|nr:glycosyltransferase family 39 protein [Oscillochloris sp.]
MTTTSGPRAQLPQRLALGLILLLAAGLRFANLGALGYVNHYYSAGIVSMLQSWHNLFFVAAEPGGAVSIDKPPLGLWIQALSAGLFGVNTFGLLLPEILAGLGSVALLYHLVGRRFGASAGLLAALAMAITPVVVATDRNNTIDSLLIFTLLLAAWAFLLASERGQLRLLLLGAALVGLGFNIKMLQAFLPLPAFYALYLLGARVGLWRKLAHLALASLLLLTIALSWAVAVDLVPADQRPFVGSSGDNSVLSLITGYNGAMRLLGRGGGGNRSDAVGPGGGATRPNGGMPPQGGSGGSGQSPSNRPGGQTPPTGTAGSPGQGGPNNRPSGQMPPSDGELAGSAAAGMSQIGQTGLLRLVTPPLSKEVSWLLPVGLLSLGILALRRPHWPLEGPHQAALLWGGWLLTAAAFFSVAGFFHEYYLSMLAPPLAALVGIGGAQLWCLRADRPRLALGLLLLAGAATLALQLLTARAFVGTAWWLMPSLALFTLGLLLAAQPISARCRCACCVASNRPRVKIARLGISHQAVPTNARAVR